MEDDALRDDLDAYVAGANADDPPPLENEADANRMLRWLGNVERHARRVEEMADDELARIAAWRADLLSGIDAERQRLTRALEGWMRGQGVKTVSTPNGQLTLRAGRASVFVSPTVEVDLISETHPSLVKTTVELSKSAIKNECAAGPEIDADHSVFSAIPFPAVRVQYAVDPDGATVPGVYFVTPIEDSFTAKPLRIDRR